MKINVCGECRGTGSMASDPFWDPYFEAREDDRDGARERYEDFCDASGLRPCKACNGTGAPRPQDRERALWLVASVLADRLVGELISRRRKRDPELDHWLSTPCQYSAYHLEFQGQLQPQIERAIQRQPEKHDLLIGFLASYYEEVFEETDEDEDYEPPRCGCGHCQWS